MATHRFTLRQLARGLSVTSLVALTALTACSAETTESALPASVIPAAAASTSEPAGTQTAVFAGGCFWGVEAVFEHLKGVSSVVAGFSGGNVDTAHYELVSTGMTGHAESVKITYDPAKISYQQLLQVFFAVAHDPTQLNRQGPDVGTQYRSAIFFSNPQQQQIAEAYIKQLNQAHTFQQPLATQVVPLKGFYAAEDYHQHYLENHPDNPYIVVNDLPKLAQLRQQYSALYRDSSS
jgi:peptide-methionine (S)-S-oxide reductase